MRILLHFARAYPWQNLVVLLCLLLSGALEGIGWSAVLPLLNLTLGSEAGAEPTGFEATVLDALRGLGIPHGFGPLVGVFVAAFWLKAPVMLLAKRQVGYTVAHVATDLRLRLLRGLLATSWSIYTRLPVGRAANAMATEADRGARAYADLTHVVTYGLQGAVALGVASAISWQVTVASLLAGVVSLRLLHVFVRMAARAGRRQTRLLQSLLGRLTDVLQSVKFLKATAREPLLGPLLEDDTQRLNKALRKQVLSKEALRSLQEPVLISFCAAGLTVGRGLDVPLTEVLLVIGLFARSLSQINRAQREAQKLKVEESALWSLLGLIEAAEASGEDPGGDTLPELSRSLRIRGVGVEYEGRQILDGADLELRAGEITAIVGASGSGKTTMVDLLTGLVRPDVGVVEVDGVPLGELDLRAWRSMIGYVPQELLMLNDSVRLNVTLGDPQLGDARVVGALRDAGAWEYVSQLPGGLDAPVGERGALLSGGQRQRVAIARALVRQPRLLILDEATAALDPENEAAIWSTVAQLRGRTTVVAISHQPALVGVADRVYRIEDRGARELAPAETEPASAERAV